MSFRTAHHWALGLAPQARLPAHPSTSELPAPGRLARWLRAPLLALNRRRAGLAARSVTAARHRLHYLDGGRGEPVLLLHGIFAEKDHWVDMAQHLTRHHRVVVPDLPGFGASERHEDQRYGYAEQVERLRAFMDAIGLQRAHVAGSSMGGTLGALLAQAYPGRVASLAFIGAPHGLRSPTPSETDRLIDAGQAPLIARSPAEFEALLERLFARRPWLPWPVKAAARDEAIQRADSNLRLWHEHLPDRHLLQSCVGAVEQPMLVLWGRRDRVFHVSGVRGLRWLCPQADIQVLDRSGHLPMMESPAPVAARYRTFLQRHRWMRR